VAPGSFSTFVTTRAELVVKKPDNLSFEEAAALPTGFLTAYYALHHLAHMTAGDRVLIHAAAGGVGLAAVQLAQRAGAEIFATAGKPEKREYLRSLGIEHIMDSRSLDFAGEIMERTSGEGVDIVLNSLAGEFIPKSLSVLRRKGRFLEIGKTGIWHKNQVTDFKSDVSYSVYDLVQQCQEEPVFVGSMLRDLMEDFRIGNLKPLPLRTFAIGEAVSAFRYMAQARHIGKIVVSHGGSTEEGLTFRTDGTYLITGGLGGLGLVVARWMLQHGARHLTLVSRRAPSDAIRATLNELERQGGKIAVFQADVSQEKEVAKVLTEIGTTTPTLRGIIHGAGVLDDGVLARQEWSRFATVLAPKVAGGWNLHALTLDLPLDFFVLFSSVASLLGSPGQGNHAAANAFLDGLAHYRRAQGLPALSINWGAWGEVGAAANLTVDEHISRRGIGTIAPHNGLQALQQVFRRAKAQVGVSPVDWSKFIQQFPARLAPMFSKMAHEARSEAKPRQQGAQQPELSQQLKQALPRERMQLIFAHVKDQVALIMGLDPSKPLDPRQPLNELGLDSLMAIELRNALGNTAGTTLPTTLLFDYPTVEAVAGYLARVVFALESPVASDLLPQKHKEAVSANLEGLSEIEMASLLADELAALKQKRLR
jgi:myxalamid-type polyketide synthase MxaB